VLTSTQPVHVIRESRNHLFRHRWVFSLDGNRLTLVRYHMEKRRRKAEEFKTSKLYERGEPYGPWEWLSLEDVPWDEELENEARFALVSNVEVARA